MSDLRSPRLRLTLVVAALAVTGAALGGVLFLGGGGSSPRSAFADAPSGLYVVGAVSGDVEDVIVAAPVDDPSQAREVARVPHVYGFTPSGTVSPDGRFVALSVADEGSPADPGASLQVIELETGAIVADYAGIDPLEAPIWLPDTSAVIVTALAAAGQGSNVTFVQVPLGGGEPVVVASAAGVLGAYPVGFDPAGAFLWVTIDGNGSTLQGIGRDPLPLSGGITRDWRLSPDGTQLAFIESSLEGGLHYRQRVVSLDGSVAAQSAPASGQQLGVAWDPASGVVAFGQEPSSSSGQAAAQSAGGFDVPLTYSPDGSHLAVQAWTGASFAEPGSARLTIVADGSRTALDTIGKVYGWAQR